MSRHLSPVLLSINAYAKHRGVTLHAVQRAIKSGRISLTPAKKVDREQADRDWEANTDSTKNPQTLKAGKDNAYAAARAERELYQARLIKLKYQERKGTLIQAARVRKKVFELARRARDTILSLPDRVAPIVAAETDPQKCHQILTEELRRLCEDLSGSAETI